MVLDKVGNNIYHVGDASPYPPLLSRLIETLEVFNNGGLTPAQVEEEYDKTYVLFPNLAESYEFDPLHFATVVQGNIDAILALGHGSLPFDQDLEHIKLLLIKRDAFKALSSNLGTTLRHFEKSRSPFPEFFTALNEGALTKASLIDVVFSSPIDMSSREAERSLLQAIIDSLSPGDRLKSIKQLYTDQLEAKQANTTTDVVISTSLIMVPETQDFVDELIAALIAADDSLSSRISPAGYEVSYPYLSLADQSLQSVDDWSQLLDNGYATTYVFNNASQNLRVDSRGPSNELTLLNLELTKTINALVALLNQNELYHQMLLNYLDMETEGLYLDFLDNELQDLNTEMDNAITDMEAGNPINEGYLVDLGARIEQNTALQDSANKRLEALGKKAQDIGNSQRGVNDFSREISSRFGISLTNKQGLMETLTVLTSGLLLARADSLLSNYQTLVQAGILVSALAVAVSLINDPSATVRSIFNVLAAPIEAVLLVTNAVICILKAAQCLMCIVKAGITAAIKKVGELVDKAQDFLNRDSNLGDLVDNVKQKIKDAFSPILEGSVCSEVQAQNRIDQDGVRSALAGTGLTDSHPNYALTDKMQTFNDVISGSCPGFFSGLLSATTQIISDEFSATVDEIKSSVENTVDNLYSLTTCGSCPPGLGAGLNLPQLPDLNLRFPDFVLNIPYLDSKVIKC